MVSFELKRNDEMKVIICHKGELQEKICDPNSNQTHTL